MTKLTNVATVDMVNGEITKVAYEGAEYAKVADGAEIGDLALCTKYAKYFTKGEFYVVTAVSKDAAHATDDEGDRYYMHFGSECSIFRKISDTSPTIEARVTALESDVAALKSGEVSVEPKRLTVGDIAKIIAEEDMYYGNIGDIVKIEIDENDRQPYKCTRISDGKDVGWFFESELEAYTGEQANETIEFEGATYRKVDREALEGDVVILRGTKTNPIYATEGKPYKATVDADYRLAIIDNQGDTIPVYLGIVNRTRETVDVYEPIEQAKPYSPKTGDIVVVTANTNNSANKVGDIGVVARSDRRNRVVVNVPGNARTGEGYTTTKLDEVRPATPSEIEAYEKALHKASFAVGDYVKIVKSYKGYEGEIAKITEIGEYSTPRGICEFEIEHLPKKDGRFAVKAEQIVKATDAEIAKATAPKLKAGDYVKITDGTRSIKNGETYEVMTRDSGLYIVDGDGDKRPFPLVFGAVKYEIVDAETAKWAQIGRKVGELKQGDIVRVLGVCSGHEIAGQLGEVVLADGTNQPKVRAVYSDELVELWSRVELVAPVESLFTTEN